MRTLICVLLLAATLPAQGQALAGLLKSAKDGNEKNLRKGLRRNRKQLFDLVALGFRVKTGTADVDVLIGKLPEDHARQGLAELAKRYAAMEEKQRSRWCSALRACRQAERQLFGRKRKKRELDAALVAVAGARARVKEAWLLARRVLVLQLAADRGKAEAPPEAAVRAALEAFVKVDDAVGEGLILLALARHEADAQRVVPARAHLTRSRDRLAAMKAARDVRAAPLRGLALLALADALVRLQLDGEAKTALEEAKAPLKDAGATALRGHALLTAVVAARAGDSKRAATLAKKSTAGVLKEEDPRVVARQGYLACLALRLSGAMKESAAFASKAVKVHKARSGEAVDGLPLRYEHALALLATKKDEQGLTQMRIVRQVAVKFGRPHVARLALERLALHEARKKNKESWKPFHEDLKKVSLGDPALDALQSAAYRAHLAVALMSTEQMAEALRAVLEARRVADELGLLVDALPTARELRATGEQATLEDQMMELLAYHPTGNSTKRLAYGLLERRRLIQIGRSLPAVPVPSGLQSELAEGRAGLARVFASWGVDATPLPDADAAESVAKWTALVSRIRKSDPEIALRRFPKPVPMQTLNTVSERQKVVFLYLHLGKKGSVAFAASGGYWNFIGIPPSAKLLENLEVVKECLAGKHDRVKFLVAAGEVHKWLITPLKGTLENRPRVAVVPDPGLEGLNLGLLVPEGTKSGTWSNTPFILRDVHFQEIPAVSLLTRTGEGRRRLWLGSHNIAALGKDADGLLPVLQVVKQDLTAAAAKKGGPARLLTGRSLERVITRGGPLAGWFRSGGLLHLGRGVTLSAEGVERAEFFRPEALVLEELPGNLERGPLVQLLLRRGVELVLLPRRSGVPAPVVAAVERRFWRGLVREGFTPGKALSEAWRAWLLGSLQVGGKVPDEKQKHPAVWGNLQLALRRL